MTSLRNRPTRVPCGDRDKRENAATGPSLVERLALPVFLSLIPLRAVLSEMHGFEVPDFVRGLAAPPTAQPATTFVIISIIAAAALASACARLWRGGPRYRWTGAELGGLILVAAAAISTVRAGQKHLALIGVLDFLAMLVFMLTLRQLLTRPWHVRLALCVIVATGALVVTKAIYQVAFEYPDTQAFFEEYHQKDFAQSAGPEGAGRVYDFEKRLQSRAATAYFHHPNVLGSYLILISVTGLTVGASRFRRRANWTVIVPVGIALGAVSALVMAQSKGAAAAFAIALVFWVVVHVLRKLLANHRRTSILAFWLIAAGGGAVLVSVLHASPGALGRSMLFRHFYWVGAKDMIADRKYAGVGANNFGRWFPRFKPVECPEEVKSPHSWLVRLAAEWGALGAVGFLFVLLGVSNRCALAPSKIPEFESPGGSITGWGMATIGCVVVGWLMVLAGAEWAYIFLTLFVAVPVWIVAFAAGALETGRVTHFPDDDLGLISVGLCAAAIGFLIHTSIDLAMFHSGAATTFFAIVAILLAVRGGFPNEPPRKAHRFGAVSLAVIGTACILTFVVVVTAPALEAGRMLETARSVRRDVNYAGNARDDSAYVDAAAAYTLDATALQEHVDELLRRPPDEVSGDHLRLVFDLLAELERRDPRNASLNPFVATAHFQAFQTGGGLAEFDAALAAMRDAVADYPTSPERHLHLARMLAGYAAFTASADARQDAAREFQNALDLDEQRVYVSKPHRFSDAQRNAIRTAIRHLADSAAEAGRSDGRSSPA